MHVDDRSDRPRPDPAALSDRATRVGALPPTLLRGDDMTAFDSYNRSVSSWARQRCCRSRFTDRRAVDSDVPLPRP